MRGCCKIQKEVMCSDNQKQFQYYKLAIDARDKLNENYHKWMTFYYVANGAILVAVTTLEKQANNFLPILFLSIVGTIISLFWHLSCKGYYYWSKSWINIIKAHERKLLQGKENELIGVYSILSKDIHDKEEVNRMYGITDYKNISTPKLTLIFSFISIVCWFILGIVMFFCYYQDLSLCCKIFISLSYLIICISLYIILPKFAQSKMNDEDFELI